MQTPILPAFLGLPGGAEWIIILVIALLLFGRRLPEVARSLGQGLSAFRKGLHEDPLNEPDTTETRPGPTGDASDRGDDDRTPPPEPHDRPHT
jgi:sec-independent protein translocase protein TatA